MPSFRWSLSDIESLVGTGELSPLGVLDESMRAVASRDQEILAWSHLALESARHTAADLAEEARRHGPRGPLHGVPVAVKDIFDTAGLPTEWGSETQRGRVPEADCELVESLVSRGCILLGKTHTTAYAYFDTGPTRNPHDPEHTPGGSSSGSAAAVAAGMVPLAIGSQTQGSVLRPASFCGIAGFKPSFGVLPLGGVMPFAPSLDHAGLFAATAGDLRVAWRALDFETESLPANEIFVVDWPPRGGVEPSMAMAFRSALQSLAAAGVTVRRVRRPSFFDALPPALWTVMAYEAAREHGGRYRLHGPRMGAKLVELLEEGLGIEDAEYIKALQVLRVTRESFRDWTRACPIVATPAAPGPAPRGLGSSGDPRCNAPITALGAPAISIPMPIGTDQMPMGLQIAGAHGTEALLLATAVRCERLLRKMP